MAVVVSVLAFMVVVLTVMVVGLLRSHAVIVRALHQAGVSLDPNNQPESSSPPPLRAAGDIDLRTTSGVPGPAHVSGRRAVDIVGQLPRGGARTISLSSLSGTPDRVGGGQRRQSTLLAFLSTGCATCATFWDAFDDGVELPPAMRLVIVTKGVDMESPATVAAIAPGGLTTVMSTEAWDDFGVPVAPYFALVDGASGVVTGEGAAHGWQLVLDMLSRAEADRRGADLADAEPVSRRDMLLGRNRHRSVDAELAAAGLQPGDSRLFHSSPYTPQPTDQEPGGSLLDGSLSDGSSESVD